MGMDSLLRAVTLDGHRCAVRVMKTGKSTWAAFGEIGGHVVASKGRQSADAAVISWQNRARRALNGQ